MTYSGRIIGIAWRPKAKAAMQTGQQAMITRFAGLLDDAKGKPGKRQLTLLSQAQWQAACDELQVQLPWTVRRANLLVEGLQFGPHMLGQQIKIGQLLLLITGETDPCIKMDRQQPGLRQALTPDWRGGVCCQVLADGKVHLGDRLEIS